jgi:hypothetical protein
MSKGLSKNVREQLEKCRDSAIAAVEVYNRPSPRFRTAHYIVLIIMSWTALFHAIFYKQRRNPWYKEDGKSAKGNRYIRVDDEIKHWELSECLKQYYGGTHPPERKNLEFLIGLRNRIEHRNLPQLDAGLYGECQAALMNLEQILVDKFGANYGLSEQLAVALQFSSVIPEEKNKAAQLLARGSVKSVKEYVEKFRGGLPSSILNSTKYMFNVYLVPRVVNREKMADASVTFIPVDESDPQSIEKLENLNVLIKEKHILVSNLDKHKPAEVVKAVKNRLPYDFTQYHHTQAWKYFKVRPKSGAENPGKTDDKYCVYDKPHKDYLYTDAWIKRLASELSEVDSFRTITGTEPKTKKEI